VVQQIITEKVLIIILLKEEVHQILLQTIEEVIPDPREVLQEVLQEVVLQEAGGINCKF
jgi:hypothetical protein